MPSPKVLKEKELIVDEVKGKLQNSASTIITDYRGLKVAQVTELRKQLRESGVEFRVIKNTLVRRATAETNLTELDEFLTGPTAIAFSEEDPVSAAKILSKFAKGNAELELKAGIVEGKVINADEVKALADLPSREGLLSMLLSVMQAPVRNFALAVKAVSEQKEEQEA